jgi:tol-pal system protein YbgF
VLALAFLLMGAIAGSMIGPPPAGATSRDMIQLQSQVAQLIQGQQDMRSALDTQGATLRTLVQQSLDGVNTLNTQMGSLQKAVQEVQANTGSRIDTMTTQTQGVSDNLQDVQARVAKMAQQLSDMQGLLQSIDAKVSGGASPAGAPATGTPLPNGAANPAAPGSSQNNAMPGATPNPASSNAPGMAPISADTLYQNALRDFTGGNYDLSRQEFSDYIQHFPDNDLAGNAQFYLGELDYAQGNFKGAISGYNSVLQNYPHSFKLAASLLKRAYAELELGMKSTAIRDLREVERRFPGSDESRRAQARLHELGASSSSRPAH